MNKMQRLFASTCALALLVTATPTRADLIAYEGFDYNAGLEVIGLSGGTGWGTAWGSNNSGITYTTGAMPGDWIRSGGLSYMDSLGNSLVTSGNALFLSGTNGTSQPFRDLSTTVGTTPGTVWVSLLTYRSGPTTNNTLQPYNPYPRAGNISFYEGGSERVAIGNASGQVSNVVALVPQGSGSHIRPTDQDFSELSFVVMRLDYSDQVTNDWAYLFVNPILGDEPALATADASTNTWFNFNLNRIRPFAGGNANNQPYAEMHFDEIRIGTTWADVTPFIPVPEPSTLTLACAGGAALMVLLRRRRP